MLKGSGLKLKVIARNNFEDSRVTRGLTPKFQFLFKTACKETVLRAYLI